jgi:cytochrome c-type biogenesis protein CcmE
MVAATAGGSRMTRKQRRLVLILGALAVLGLAAGLVLFALNDSIVFFRTPSDIVSLGVKPGTRLRIGGLVKEGSVSRDAGQNVAFEVTDTVKGVAVRYHGLLPDLFREGQGVVAEGVLQADGSFLADSVLAKHDENYMPKEVADALKKQGVWNDGKGHGSQPGTAPAGTKSP